MSEYEKYGEEEYEFEDEDEAYEWTNDDMCYECSGYGDDYFVNEEGELECACFTCPFNNLGGEED